jgi:tRNA-2-methylthio-N6-dimethylallyladenosine synthase
MFAYSVRRGTAAASMPGHIEDSVKQERLQTLMALQEGIQREVFASLAGTHHELLIEGVSKRGGGVTGRIGRGITVNVASPGVMGEMRPVTVTEPKHTTLQAKWRDLHED